MALDFLFFFPQPAITTMVIFKIFFILSGLTLQL